MDFWGGFGIFLIRFFVSFSGFQFVGEKVAVGAIDLVKAPEK
jgi:hypothetical protein